MQKNSFYFTKTNIKEVTSKVKGKSDMGKASKNIHSPISTIASFY